MEATEGHAVVPVVVAAAAALEPTRSREVVVPRGAVWAVWAVWETPPQPGRG